MADRPETTLDPDRTTHLGIWRDELDDISREFFNWNVPQLPVVVQEAIAAGMRDDPVGLMSRFVFAPGLAELIGPALVDHCYTETTHLAGFLPHVHARVTAWGPAGH